MAESTSAKATSSSDSTKKSSSPPPTNTESTKPVKKSWRDKFRPQTEEHGKDRSHDASLSDKDRWKDWQKAKDKEQAKGSTAGFFTQQYKNKGSWGYWLDLGW
ncbi:uncharacterized protein K460DRAFT_369534 [Cucurbitaria berberidis CBS 394.84]|uniref:Uncharacterized protein n=1 Tax=Cucurbitaria berberidis CBS 394.84 TaxID=1168544 RepID=A0A9P4L4H8_9PLEO|nr:uncharacterized protein K460DRAFT_369534 [Cucurbitaria berberidis CBS 394.84]KAF1841505.1 hypothetical protein K460DRAFT_369534 [Cucurbitaria berberidis CBS 394.84]